MYVNLTLTLTPKKTLETIFLHPTKIACLIYISIIVIIFLNITIYILNM